MSFSRFLPSLWQPASKEPYGRELQKKTKEQKKEMKE
jgi:hypothetical protein